MASGGDVQAGGNGSVHWRVNGQEGVSMATGMVKVNGGARQIGATLKQKGFFVVTLRFDQKQLAIQELEAALERIKKKAAGPKFVATLRVPAISRAEESQNPPFEVKVAW